MHPGSHAETPTVFHVVSRAVAVCDPDGDDGLIADLLLDESAQWLQAAGITV